MKGKSIFYIILIILCLAAIAGIFVWRGSEAAKAPAPAPTPVPTPDTKIEYVEVEKLVEAEKEITATVIKDGLRDIGKLATQEYFFTEVAGYSSVKTLFSTDIKLPFSESNYLVSYDGTVTAGIDFGDIEVAKTGDRVTVKLPDAEILSVDIDYDSFKLYSEREGLLNSTSVADYNASLVELEANAKSKALEKGILEAAQNNARLVVSNFITGLAGPGCTVSFV